MEHLIINFKSKRSWFKPQKYISYLYSCTILKVISFDPIMFRYTVTVGGTTFTVTKLTQMGYLSTSREMATKVKLQGGQSPRFFSPIYILQKFFSVFSFSQSICELGWQGCITRNFDEFFFKMKKTLPLFTTLKNTLSLSFVIMTKI